VIYLNSVQLIYIFSVEDQFLNTIDFGENKEQF